jgi:hypothetical protein
MRSVCYYTWTDPRRAPTTANKKKKEEKKLKALKAIIM